MAIKGREKLQNGWEKHYALVKSKVDAGFEYRCPKCLNKLNLDSDFRKASLSFVCHRCKHIYKKPVKASELEPDWMIKSKFGKKRVLRDDQFWNNEKILYKIKEKRILGIVPDVVKRDCALAAMLFLTGARISEVVGMDKPLPKKPKLINKLINPQQNATHTTYS